MLLETCREPVEMLVELTREFIRMYGEKKREKNILDFTDMEHFALEILIQRFMQRKKMAKTTVIGLERASIFIT